jgi:hypothetical protein
MGLRGLLLSAFALALAATQLAAELATDFTTREERGVEVITTERQSSVTTEDRRRLFFGGPAPTPNCEIHTSCVDCGTTFGCSWCHQPLGCVFPKKTTGINGRGKSVVCSVFPKTCAGEATLPPVPTPLGGNRKRAPMPTPFPTAYDARDYKPPVIHGSHHLDTLTGIPHRNSKLYRKC